MRHDSIETRRRAVRGVETVADASVCDMEGWGRFVLAWKNDGIVLLGLPSSAPGRHLGHLAARGIVSRSTSEVPRKFLEPLRAYFAGHPEDLAALPVSQVGTAFQLRVWNALREIPLGRPCTYGNVAARVGQPSAARAVGNACGMNLVSIAVPCHRVLAHGGAVGGYTGGIAWKQRLLEHETRIAAQRG